MSANAVWQRVLTFFPELLKGGSGANPTIDWTKGSVQAMTLNAATVTPTFVNPPGGCNLALVLTQDGTGGRSVVWPGSVSWIGGTPPILLSGPGQVTLVNFYFDGTTYFGSIATAGSPQSLLPWTDVAAGTTLAVAFARPNLSCDASGGQTVLNLPTAAAMANADGFEILIRATGTMVSPILINAGAGTTVEFVGGALGPGNFGASSYLPYEALVVRYKYDKSTTQWKVSVVTSGTSLSAQKQLTWVVAGGGLDSNSGLDGGHALATSGEVIRRLGGTVGGSVIVDPLGGGADDWPRLLSNIALACALTGTALVMAGGAWSCQSALAMPSNLTIYGSQNVTVTANLPNGGITDSVFQMVSATAGTTIALSVDNVLGTKTLSAATAPGGGWAIGQQFQFEVGAAHLHGNTYTIKNVAGLGPFTLTVDRPVLYQGHVATANLNLVTTLIQNVKILGGGMKLTGSCSQFVEMQGCYRCTVEDLVLDGTTMPPGGSGLIMDTFSLRNVAERVTADGGNNLAPIFWLIGEENEILSCQGFNSTGNGVAYNDAAGNVLRDYTGYSCTGAGILVSSDGGINGAATNEGNVVESCFCYGCGTGLAIGDGASNVSVTDSFFPYNGNGILLDNTLPLGAPSNIRITSCFAGNNTNAGLTISAGTKGTVVSGLDVSGNGTKGVAAADDATLSNIVSSGGCPNGTVTASAGVVTLDGAQLIVNGNAGGTAGVAGTGTSRVFAKNLRITVNSAGFVPAVSSSNTARVSCVGVHVTATTACEGFLALGTSTVSFDNVTVDGASVAGSIGANAGAGCTVRIGKNVHMDAMTGPTWNVNAGAHWNRSSVSGTLAVTLNGLAAQAVAWPDLQSSDDILVELTTPGGTPSPVTVTKTPATGFSLAGTNVADTSVVNYVVL